MNKQFTHMWWVNFIYLCDVHNDNSTIFERKQQLPQKRSVCWVTLMLQSMSESYHLTTKKNDAYRSTDWQPLPVNRVHWQWGGGSGMPAIEFTGIPFMFVGSKRLVCHQGKDLAVAQKRKYFEEKARKMVSSLLHRRHSHKQTQHKPWNSEACFIMTLHRPIQRKIWTTTQVPTVVNCPKLYLHKSSWNVLQAWNVNMNM